MNRSLVNLYRERLSDISWFNRCLCESIARRANREDECTGHFWEGRFKSQRIVGESAILACSVYVDLNPIRAGIAATPEDSDFTSVQDRIRSKRNLAWASPIPLVPSKNAFDISTDEYLELVDTTGRIIKDGKRSIPSELEPIFTRMKINPSRWLDTTLNLHDRFQRVVAPVHILQLLAKAAGKNWFQGLSAAKAVFTQ